MGIGQQPKDALRPSAIRWRVSGLHFFIVGVVLCSDPVQVDASPGDLDVEVRGGLLTLSADDVSIKRLLEGIASKSGLTLVLNDALDERINVELHDVPFSKAMRRVLSDHSFVLHYARSPPNRLRAGTPRPLRLLVLSSRRQSDKSGSVSLGSMEAPVDLGLALTSGDVNVRLDTLAGLSKSDFKQTSTAVLAAALDDEHIAVREQAIDALSDLAGESAIPALEHALRDSDASVREAAIVAIADIGGARSAAALSVALHDSNASVRVEAVDALGEIGGPGAIRLLQQALGDEHQPVREAAAEFLAELTEPGFTDKQ